ncbi:MAG: mechanosensitive ion channel protein MscS [Rhizobiales bacterium 12-66-7]|nr:MAG: mechanosensitive ion channel protein MscS [Rhizobiales bacterium 12-66-7]
MSRPIARAAILAGFLIAVLVAGLSAPGFAAPASDPAVQAAREKVDATRSSLDSIEGALSVEGLRADDLDELRNRLDPVRRDLGARTDALVPRLANAKTRAQELGEPPAAGAPPEDPSVTADRESMQSLIAELDAVIKQNRALLVRADQLSDRLSSRRRSLFTGQLFDRSMSILDPSLWTGAASGLGGEGRSLRFLANDWLAFALQRQGGPVLAAITAGALAIFGLVFAGGLFLRRKFACPPPVAVIAAFAFLAGFDITPPRAADVIHGLLVAVFIQSIGLAVSRAVLAPGQAWRRLPPLSDYSASLGYRYFSWMVWTLSIAAFLNSIHRALFAPVALTVATSAVMALLIGLFISRLLVVLAREGDEETAAGEAQTGGVPWVRFLMWLVLAGLAGALVAGYIGLAAFAAARIVVATTVIAGLYVLNALIEAFFGSLTPEATHARQISRTLGLRQERLDLLGTLIAALLKLMLLAIGLLVIAGSWGTSTADVMDTIERASFGVRIGATTITLSNVIYAVALLMSGIFIARTIQRWVSTKFLPRTGLEPSLQSSIATIVGYIGTIVALMVAMGEIGLNLENIALVAGALSVGIGFGLQSIVSNFVSGLILLAERPIRVGDTINVKGEEGYVRRISVRSTEIETFERATVIVPNSDLISGMVKNFTHSNTTGRVIVAVNVTYDGDLEEVRDILVACACDHPQVLQSPPPRVFLTKFADAGLGFELRCVVANVDYGLTVKSDLHFAILTRFRKAGIGMACQPRLRFSTTKSPRGPASSAPRNSRRAPEGEDANAS